MRITYITAEAAGGCRGRGGAEATGAAVMKATAEQELRDWAV